MSSAGMDFCAVKIISFATLRFSPFLQETSQKNLKIFLSEKKPFRAVCWRQWSKSSFGRCNADGSPRGNVESVSGIPGMSFVDREVWTPCNGTVQAGGENHEGADGLS